jgi:hypothetical protein
MHNHAALGNSRALNSTVTESEIPPAGPACLPPLVGQSEFPIASVERWWIYLLVTWPLQELLLGGLVGLVGRARKWRGWTCGLMLMAAGVAVAGVPLALHLVRL